MTSLKSCWDNLKKKTRKHFAEICKEVLAIGGRKMTISDDLIAERVKNVIQPSVDVLRNPFDSDCVTDDVNVEQDKNDNDDVIFEVEALDEVGLTTNKWTDWTPAMLHSKKSTELQVPVYDDEETTTPDSDLLSYAEVMSAMEMSSKENQNPAANSAANPASSTAEKKTVKRTRQTRMPIISAVRRNQCFYQC